MNTKLRPCLFAEPLRPKQRVAFVMSPRLGDSLLSMVVVNNLQKNAIPVTVFGNYLYALKSWFPQVDVLPLPEESKYQSVFSSFDILLHAYPTDVLGDTTSWHAGVKVLDYSPYYRQRIVMPDIQTDICRYELGLSKIVRTNDIIFPDDLVHRRYENRVVIHPTSNDLAKNWLPQRFLSLVQLLKQHDYQPQLIVGPNERQNWQWVVNEGVDLPEFSSLDAVARWVYESGWFIGNDSGIGHLASNLNIPTVTLVMRARVAQRWRPSWAQGVVVLPKLSLPTRQLKEKFWKYLITVRQVEGAFFELQKVVGT